jgi:hypothetical protein
MPHPCVLLQDTKYPIKNPWQEPSHRRQKGRPKKGQKMQPAGTKEGRELVPLFAGYSGCYFVLHS